MIPVLHLRSGRGLYGADRVLLALAEATTAPFRPIIGAIGSEALRQAADRRGLASARFTSGRRLDLPCAAEVARCARTEGIGLLHAHDFKSLSLAVLASRRTGLPVVATFHGESDASLKLRGYEAVGRALGNATRGVVAVSRPLEARLRRWIFAAPVRFIPNGLAPIAPVESEERARSRAALGIEGQDKVALCLGRLAPEKGQAVLLQAMRRLARPPRLLIAGDGPERGRLKALARGLPVHFLGYREATRPLYAAADLVVLPSLTEGLPLVALEAGLHRLPLVASQVGELPALLAEEALVPPGDPDALASRLGIVRTDARLRALADDLHARVEARYTAAAMARRVQAELYLPALAPTRGEGRRPAPRARSGPPTACS